MDHRVWEREREKKKNSRFQQDETQSGPKVVEGRPVKSLAIKRTFCPATLSVWKRLKAENPEGKNFRKLLRRKQSSAKISKISRNTLKASESDIFYLMKHLLKYLLRTFCRAIFRSFCSLHLYPLALSERCLEISLPVGMNLTQSFTTQQKGKRKTNPDWIQNLLSKQSLQ